MRWPDGGGVHGISARIDAGQRVAIVGRSGSGKSTLGKSLLGLCDGALVQADRFEVGGVNMLSADERAVIGLRGNVVSMVWQDPLATLDPLQRIGDALMETVLVHNDWPRDEAQKVAIRALEQAGLEEAAACMQAFPHELSGGQRQRVGIALATVTRPSLLVADEPTSSLDPDLAVNVARVLRRICVDTDCALVLVTHDIELARAVADDAIVMEDGRIAEYGAIEQLWTRPESATTRDLLAAAAADLDDGRAG